jgi:hypothetical protein
LPLRQDRRATLRFDLVEQISHRGAVAMSDRMHEIAHDMALFALLFAAMLQKRRDLGLGQLARVHESDSG